MQEEIKKKNCKAIIVNSNCDFFLQETKERFDLIFLDPPFNQKKEYAMWNDDMDDVSYWNFMRNVCEKCFLNSKEGGTIYFMQREKNVENVLKILRETGWTFQNLIIWKKLTSAAPLKERYSKQYQIIVFASKGKKIKTFNKLRINPPLPPHYKSDREKGIYLTDVWDDIRELTSGYFAGKEAFRGEMESDFINNNRPLRCSLE